MYKSPEQTKEKMHPAPWVCHPHREDIREEKEMGKEIVPRYEQDRVKIRSPVENQTRGK